MIDIPIIHKALALPSPLTEDHAGIWLIKPEASSKFTIWVVTEVGGTWTAIEQDSAPTDLFGPILLGRYSTGVGPVQEITLGSNLTLSVAGVLNSADTTYTQITNAELTTGTSTEDKIVSAKVLADWLNPLLSSKADDNTVVKLTGNQTVAGTKTFTDLPESAVAPTTANQFTNKAYVDQEINNITAELGGDKYFIYDQNTPSALWSITHTLDKKVSVTVTDSAGTVIEGQVTLNTDSQVEIQFNAPFGGHAYLN